MPFEPWDDATTRRMQRQGNPAIMVDPKTHFHETLTKIRGRVFQVEELRLRRCLQKRKWESYLQWFSDDHFMEDYYKGQDCFIVAPGPSLGDHKPELFKDKLTIFLNSAVYWGRGAYWATAEVRYLDAVFREPIFRQRMRNQVVVVSGRAFAFWIERKALSRNVAICSDAAERQIIPFRAPGPSMFLALAHAWLWGCKRVFVFGMDLGCVNRKRYCNEIPSVGKQLEGPYDDQIRGFKQLAFPGMELCNASPHSSAYDIAFYPVSVEYATKSLTDAPPNVYPERIQKALQYVKTLE